MAKAAFEAKSAAEYRLKAKVKVPTLDEYDEVMSLFEIDLSVMSDCR